MSRAKKLHMHIKKRTAIILGIIGIFIIAGTIAAIWQWNNIAALKYNLSYSQEEIGERIEDNEQKLVEAMDRLIPARVRDLTDAEKARLASEDLTREEAINLLVDDTYPHDVAEQVDDDNNSQSQSQSLLIVSKDEKGAAADGEINGEYEQDGDYAGIVSSGAGDNVNNLLVDSPSDIASILPAAPLEDEADSNADAFEQSDAKLVELIAEAYVLRAYYTSRLEGMKNAAAADYTALNTAERTQQKKMSIGLDYINKAGVLEAECDGMMDNLISRLETELQQTGGDTTVIQEIKSYYAEEKSLKKAYYMSLYK